MDNNTNKNRQELIDRYLLGEMNEPEQKAFEEQLANDEELRLDVEISRHIVNAFQYEGEQRAFDAMKSMSEDDFKKLLNLPEAKDSEENIQDTTNVRPFPQKRPEELIQTSAQMPPLQKRSNKLIWISATVAAVALILLYIGFRPEYSTEQLFAQYYITQPYETDPVRGGSELTIEERKLVQQAKEFYQQKEFRQASSAYNQYLADKPDWKAVPEEIIFHSAICQFETGHISEAIEKLSFLASSGQSEFRDEALWNLAFIYLKDNQRSKTKECLQQLIDKDNNYADKAKALLDSLNKKVWF